MIITSYDPDADAMYVRISPKGTRIAATREMEPGVMLDLDEAGRLVGIEVLGIRARGAAGTEAIAAQ